MNSDSPPTHSRHDFCLALKAARERNGVTLARIAEATKVPASLFAALERDDLRCWPKGIFRRAFFRGYVEMIGVDVAEACAEFAWWFPDGEGTRRTKIAETAQDGGQAHGVRLALDPDWHGPPVSIVSRVLPALIDAAAVVLLAAALAWATGLAASATAAVVALVYFSMATVLLGQSPVRRAMSSWRRILDSLTRGPATAIAEARRQGAGAFSQLLGRGDGDRRGAADDSATAPPLRVRIKMSP